MEHNGVTWPEDPPVYIESFGSVDEIMKPGVIEAEFKASRLEALGVVVDADGDAAARWDELRVSLGQRVCWPTDQDLVAALRVGFAVDVRPHEANRFSRFLRSSRQSSLRSGRFAGRTRPSCPTAYPRKPFLRSIPSADPGSASLEIARRNHASFRDGLPASLGRGLRAALEKTWSGPHRDCQLREARGPSAFTPSGASLRIRPAPFFFRLVPRPGAIAARSRSCWARRCDLRTASD